MPSSACPQGSVRLRSEAEAAPARSGNPRRRARDRRLHAGTAAALVAAVAALGAAAPAPARNHRAVTVSRSHRATVSGQVIRDINRVRASYGLRPLRLDPRIARGADQHSREMARYHYFAHQSKNGGSAIRRVRRYARVRFVGEVIGYLQGYPRRRWAATIVRLWMHSSGHRAILLDGRFRRLGVGRRIGWVDGGRVVLFTVDVAAARRR